MKRLLPLLLALVLVISVIVPAYATGDGNFDGGGGGMGNGSKTNYWNPGMDGVRVSIVGVWITCENNRCLIASTADGSLLLYVALLMTMSRHDTIPRSLKAKRAWLLKLTTMKSML